MKLIFTSIPETGDDLSDVPEDWNLGRHIELHWLPDDRHPDVVAEVIVARIDCDPDGTRHLHLVNAHPGECS
jgi:hypothetical protein